MFFSLRFELIYKVNGIPGHANSYYINDILKGELDFQGFVISDYMDIKRLYTRDKLAASEEDAVRIAGNFMIAKTYSLKIIQI